MNEENYPELEIEKTLPSPSPAVVPVAAPPPAPAGQPRRVPSLFTLATIVLLGGLIGGVIGGLIVYLGRPYLDQRLGLAGQAASQPLAVALATNPPPAAAVGVTNSASGAAASVALITPTPDQSPEINRFVISNTRHFTGNPAAPVTIIEFSDFQ